MNRLVTASILVLALLGATAVYAAGYTTLAVPTRIDVVRSDGLMIFGSFGNPNGCQVPDVVFVPSSVPQYSQIYAALLSAHFTGASVQLYVAECDAESWYSNSTYNTMVTGVGTAIIVQ